MPGLHSHHEIPRPLHQGPGERQLSAGLAWELRESEEQEEEDDEDDDDDADDDDDDDDVDDDVVDDDEDDDVRV